MVMRNKGFVDKTAISFYGIMGRQGGQMTVILVGIRSHSYIPQAELRQIDRKISALPPDGGRCLHVLFETSALF